MSRIDRLLRVIFVAGILFVPVLSMASDISDWIVPHRKAIEQEVAEHRTAEAKAQAVLNQALRAEALAVELKDNSALPVAREAVRLSKLALEKARANIARTSVFLQRFDATLKYIISKKENFALPVVIKGQVLKKTDKGWAPFEPNAPMNPGDVVSTGSDGRLDIFFKDGSRVHLGPNSVFILSREKSPGERLYELLNGKIHNRIIPRAPGAVLGRVIKYQAPTMVASVRGTEFDLVVDDTGLTHLISYSGNLELEATPEKIDWKKLNRFWEKGENNATEVLAKTDKPLRVAYIEGDVRTISLDGKPREATASDTLASGERLAVGKNGFAHAVIKGGCILTLSKGSAFLMDEEAGGTPLYLLESGLFRLACKPQDKTQTPLPVITLPNAAIAPHGKAFEALIEVKENGLADITPLSGSFKVEASEEEIDLDGTERWWEEGLL